MLNGIDISNHQLSAGLDETMLLKILPSVDFVIVKATGGKHFVDKSCDKYVQILKREGKLWGFYHFANDNKSLGTDAITEADYFVDNCANYFGEGIPVLDWEVDQVSVAWVNQFVQRVYERTKVRCWIYANPWRFNQGGVDRNCARWIAAYPLPGRPTLSSNPGNIPSTDGTVACWQYSGMGSVPPYTPYLDLDHYYGTAESWKKYAIGDRELSTTNPPNVENPPIEETPEIPLSKLENDEFIVYIERK